MYLHIGNNYTVDIRDVIGIFDIENTTVEKCTKKLLERAEKEHHCIYTTYEMPKSFIITMKNGRERVYISLLSAATLKKRLKGNGGF
ncbi:extracellular matrix regulator RemB [Ruminococcus sp.]|uniref:extracellular matrix regulator RemB n=1 Tax=Ruminococcus sp. TaxID=41978 RepID=UPI0026006FA7|nr:extracellular matrix/biofilm biosynthesis regulator RemA family protein [Ruminococcus sp.]